MSTPPFSTASNDANGSTTNISRSDPFLSNDFYPLNQAHNAVLAALRADESAPDADLYRRIASNSDGQGHLYRTLDSNGQHENVNTNANANVPEPFNGIMSSPKPTADAHHADAHVYNALRHANSIPLPPYLTNIIKETKLSSLMGILPEGNMVWVSVDDSLYLWEYGSLNGGRKKEDFVCFRVPSGQCVVSVGIVKPKAGESLCLALPCLALPCLALLSICLVSH